MALAGCLLFSNIRAIAPKLCARSSLAIVADHWP